VRSVFVVTKELLTNIKRINRVALYELLIKGKDGVAGYFWIWLNPAFQIFIYAFIFMSGIRRTTDMEGISYFYWMIPGFIVWIFSSGTVVAASRSILAKITTVTKMKFPLSALPVVTVINNLYIHLMLLATVFVILFVGGFQFNLYMIQIIYYLFATVCFLIAISIFTSSITTVVRDFQHVVYNSIRMIFFCTPILFTENFEGALMTATRCNPFAYLVIGYRQSLVLYSNTLLMDFQRGIIFWGVVLVLYFVGSILHIKMRKNVLDYA